MARGKLNSWYKSGRIDFANTEKIDAEKGILFGVIMCQVGEAKGHGVHLEQEFIDAGIAYAQKYHSEKGMKARFGHPSMSNETLGTEMGRFKNFRVEGDKMVADLHLFESSNLSPTQPGMRDWMVSMAGEDPEAIMCSIVFRIGSFYQRNDKGEKFDIEWVPRGWGGEWRSKDKENKFDPDAKIYVTLKELMFCDIVDQGAATDKLLSENFNSDKFSVIATQFLNEHPEIEDFLQENPDKFLEFLNSRLGQEENPEPGLVEQLLSFLKPKQSNTKSFYMSKIQLNQLTLLSEKLKKGEVPTPEDFSAVQEELKEQGLDVVVIDSEQYQKSESSLKLLADKIEKAVLSLKPEIQEEEKKDFNLADSIKSALAEKDKEIARLKKALDEKSEEPEEVKNKGQQKFDDKEDEELGAAEKEQKAYQDVMSGANAISG